LPAHSHQETLKDSDGHLLRICYGHPRTKKPAEACLLSSRFYGKVW
jgi:hypothetical protein